MLWQCGPTLARHLVRILNCVQTKNNSVLKRYNIHHFRNFLITSCAMSSDNSHSTSGQHLNRLANEKSPYLLQHATNPVDWYPWGEEAFDKAKREEKLIFLSVGYSTCHWCHVMERESFTSEAIGQLLNEHFVSIKVDREERPDVDRVYMTFIQATSGSGGWPMSVWLTPDLKPIVGGTYFPPNDRYYGRPGFASVLRSIAKQWRENRDKVIEQGTVILDVLTQGLAVTGGSELPAAECLDICYTMMSKTYDDEHGGFGKAPKFPQPVNFNFLFHLYALKPSSPGGKQGLEMSLHTLKSMAYGGIRDHIAQGFHRYSTDAEWHLPHFEKMLYDQAQIARAYLDAYQISKDEFFADVARDILTYVSRDLSDPSGGFYSAEDADSLPTHDAQEKREGAFCVWTENELRTLLNDPVEGMPEKSWADIFIKHYGVNKLGNVDPYKDVHKELSGQNILYMKGTEVETAADLKLEPALVSDILQQCRQRLLKVREQRPRPHKDTKILTAWNGLMISAFARAAQVLQESSFLDRAIKSLNFVKSQLYLPEKKLLLRSCYCDDDGELIQINNPIPGFAEDYAFIIQALLDTYEASLDQTWLEWAEELQIKQDHLFLDEEHGGYFTTTTDDKSILLRLKDDQDGAEPSANSVTANNLTRLSNYLSNSKWDTQARHLLTLFHERLTKLPIAMPQMLCALVPLHYPVKQIVIVGPHDAEDTKKLLRTVHSLYIPVKTLIVNDKANPGFLSTRLPVPLPDTQIDNKATAHVCFNYACALPVTTAEELERQLMS